MFNFIVDHLSPALANGVMIVGLYIVAALSFSASIALAYIALSILFSI